MKKIIILSAIALTLTTGFTCSKNAPQQAAQPAAPAEQAQMAAPTEGQAAEAPATAAPPTETK